MDFLEVFLNHRFFYHKYQCFEQNHIQMWKSYILISSGKNVSSDFISNSGVLTYPS